MIDWIVFEPGLLDSVNYKGGCRFHPSQCYLDETVRRSVGLLRTGNGAVEQASTRSRASLSPPGIETGAADFASRQLADRLP